MSHFPFTLPLLLDGGTGTNLIAAGLPAGVCVEDWIIKNPAPLQELQRGYAQAGSNAVYAATFGANRAKLAHYGLENQVAEINRKLVQISREAVGTGVLVGGDMAPTGLFIEPYGDAKLEEIMAIYREQAFALKEAGADFIGIETMMSLWELRAAVLAARETELPIFTSITVEGNGRTIMGTSLLSCVITLQALGVSAVGVNCSEGPVGLAELIDSVFPYAEVPLIVKPNGGKPDPNDSSKFDLTAQEFALHMRKLIEAGASVLGGCCGTNPEHIRLLNEAIEETPTRIHSEIDTFAAANDKEVFFLHEPEGLTFSEPIPCDYDLEDTLLDMEDERVHVALVSLSSEDDVQILSAAVAITPLPIAIRCDSLQLLEQALLNYHGRAVVDSASDIDREELQAIADRFGAIVV
ncbi:MAG: homocysteine S-methyltransferase family protein [Oscillospiraceae bacterium]|jgi:5-methyltetrahydrofolate--homocysteine methyltransferase|nr:homocysteine S-methyltransferase family protein [Oscillospiraceae bacterium]